MSDGVRWSYRSGSLLAIGVAGMVLLDAVLLLTAVDDWRNGRPGTAAVEVLWALAVSALVAEVFVRPRVTTGDDGVRLVNPFRSVLVPWAVLERVDAELSLQLVTPGRTFSSWAATGSRNARPRRRPAVQDDPDLAGEPGGRPAPAGPNLTDVLRTKGMAAISGAVQCKLFIDEAWQAWRLSPQRRTEPAGSAGSTEPQVRWHVRSSAVLITLVVAVAVGSALL